MSWGTAPAFAQAEVDLETGGVVKMFQMRTTDGAELVPRRGLTQFLGLQVRSTPPEGGAMRWDTGLRLRLDSDLGLNDRVAGRIERDDLQFVAATIQLARLRVHDLFGRLDVSIGRDVLVDPVGAQLLDGIQIRAQALDGWFVRAYAGLSATPQQRLTFEAPFENPWTGPRDALFDDQPLTFGAGMGYSGPRTQAQVALRRTLSVASAPRLQPDASLQPQTLSGNPVIDERIGASIYTRPIDALELSASAAWSPATRLLERADVQITTHLPWQALYIGLHGQHFTPTFPLGSIWTAFGARPTTSIHTLGGLNISAGPGSFQLDLNAGARAYGDPDTIGLPLPTGAHASSTGWESQALLTWQTDPVERYWWPGWSAWALARVQSGQDPVGTMVVGEVGGNVQILRKRLDLRARALTITTEQPQQPTQAGQSAAAQLAADINISNRSRVEVIAEYSSTPAFLHASRFYVRYGLDLTLFD